MFPTTTELATQAHTETLHQINLSQEDPGAEQAPLQDQGEGDRQHEQGGEETVGGAEGARQSVQEQPKYCICFQVIVILVFFRVHSASGKDKMRGDVTISFYSFHFRHRAFMFVAHSRYSRGHSSFTLATVEGQ